MCVVKTLLIMKPPRDHRSSTEGFGIFRKNTETESREKTKKREIWSGLGLGGGGFGAVGSRLHPKLGGSQNWQTTQVKWPNWPIEEVPKIVQKRKN